MVGSFGGVTPSGLGPDGGVEGVAPYLETTMIEEVPA